MKISKFWVMFMCVGGFYFGWKIGDYLPNMLDVARVIYCAIAEKWPDMIEAFKGCSNAKLS